MNPNDALAVLTIDLDAIGENWRRLARLAAPAECGAAVKADAYGCGIGAVVPALGRAGCRTFFTAHVSEGRRVRAALGGTAARIFVLSGFHPEAAPLPDYLDHGLGPVLGSAEELSAWSAAVAALAPASRPPSALHVDTGMNRLGFPVEAARLLPPGALEAAGVAVVMTHLVSAEQPDDPVNLRQIAAFDHARERALRTLPASLANSSGIFLPQRPFHDLVRPGYALYGGNPVPDRPNPMRPVVTLTAKVLQTRVAPAGATVGYNGRWTAHRPSRLATLGVGYADGLPIGASGIDRPGALVYVGDRPCPVLGRISMDLTIIDTTDCPEPVAAGQEVEILGPHASVDDLARQSGTIGYDILTSLGRRHLRQYRGDGTSARR